MIKRHLNHQIDTISVRKIMAKLSENWLIRSMEERDYGIDLMLEYFDNTVPTGQVCYIQVKGKKSKFPNNNIILRGFPVKTAEYALLFEAPFFVFHTSIESDKIVFVWLQKYIHTELTHGTKNKWKKQKTISIKFPDENVLDSSPAKIVELLQRHSVRPDGIRFLSLFNELKLHYSGVENGQYAVAATCAEIVGNIILEKRYFQHYCLGRYPVPEKLSLTILKNAFKRISCNKKLIKRDSTIIQEQITNLGLYQEIFLSHDHVDHFQWEVCDEKPY